MKRFYALVLLMIPLLVFAGGCQTTAITPGQFDQTILANEATIQSLSGAATQLALLSVDEQHRAGATADVHNLAEAVMEAVNQKQPSVAGFQAIVIGLLNKSNSPYVIIAGTVFDSVTGLVNAQLTTTYSQLSASDQEKAALDLIQAVTQGVINASAQTLSLPNHPVKISDAWCPPSFRIRSPFDDKSISV